ncbi:hypothetical protein ACJU26_05380 [Acidithiobacillus sp. M4-SHS-6]|uniref:hypothetical protein n=1 Tax=Acidithiobacillus sp. M4-SHS-6 TaxID=3383024 RepID=UPI0039BE0371
MEKTICWKDGKDVTEHDVILGHSRYGMSANPMIRVQESMRVSPDKIMVGEERKPPFYPLSMAENSRDMAQELADKIQRRMEAGSPLLLLGDENDLTSILKDRGIIQEQPYEGIGKFLLHDVQSLWLRCHLSQSGSYYDDKSIYRLMLTSILQASVSLQYDHPMIVVVNSMDAIDVVNDGLHISDDALRDLMQEQKKRHIEIVITDYAAFMAVSQDVQRMYLENCLSSDWHCAG